MGLAAQRAVMESGVTTTSANGHSKRARAPMEYIWPGEAFSSVLFELCFEDAAEDRLALDEKHDGVSACCLSRYSVALDSRFFVMGAGSDLTLQGTVNRDSTLA